MQAAPNPAHEIMSNINAVNAKIDSLVETIGDIAIDDGLKQHIDKRLAEIAPKTQEKKKRDFKIKDLDTYDGESQNLRSWLTAAGLQMENKGIEGDEAKINFIAGYLRCKAWNWFEPILREKEPRKRQIGVTALPVFLEVTKKWRKRWPKYLEMWTNGRQPQSRCRD